jgi:hypothetical protein
MSCLDYEVEAVLAAWAALKARKSPRPVDGRPVGAELRAALVLLEDKWEMTSGHRALERLAAAAVELRDAASSQDSARVTRAYTEFITTLEAIDAIDAWQRT